MLQWLAVGLFINCLAFGPFAVVQGAGRPDLTAKLHILELPVYLVALFGLIKVHGIEGAAMAWTGRATLDAIVLFGLADRFLASRPALKWQSILLLLGALGTFALAAVPRGLEMKGLLLLFIFVGFVLAAWFLVLSPEERKLAQQIS